MTVPVRGSAPELAATVKFTVLVPVRVLAPPTVTQLTPLDTVQEQPLVVVTRVLPEPPAVMALNEDDDKLNVHAPA